MKNKLLILLFFLLSACTSHSDKNISIAYTTKTDSIVKNIPYHINGDYKICDTCSTTIVTHHDECTGCRDFEIDSGTVFIPQLIIDKFQTQLNKVYLTIDPSFKANYLWTGSLYLQDKNDFNKLWETMWSLGKVYRLKGHVVDVKRWIIDNGNVEPFFSLYFKVDQATLLYDNQKMSTIKFDE